MTILACLNLLVCFNWFLHCFIYGVQCLSDGHHPPECTGARLDKLHETSQSVFLKWWWLFSLILLVWVHLSLKGIYCMLYFPNNPTKKKSGAVRSVEWGMKQETTHCEKKRRSASYAVWAIVPSCWNPKLWLSGSFGARNSLIISV